MHRLIRIMLLLSIIVFGHQIADGQLRPKQGYETQKKAKGTSRGIPFLFQIEPAFSFPSENRHPSSQDPSKFEYKSSVVGANLSILSSIYTIPKASNLPVGIELRFRFTSGFWHFKYEYRYSYGDYGYGYSYSEKYSRNWVPIEFGFDLGVPYDLRTGKRVTPYAGFQYGFGFHVDDETPNLMDRMYTIRIGIDYSLSDNINLGASYVMNKVMEEFDIKNSYYPSIKNPDWDFKYNQIALGLTIR